MTEKDQERIVRLEANRAALVRLASQFQEEAGLNKSIAETMGGVLTRDYEDTDFAQVMSDREVNDRLVQLLSENREQVERALSRLAEGKYGECEDCGNRIPTERLRFRPEATRCVDCQGRWDRLNRRSA
jgi:DnaK suppressor protein